MSLYASVQNQIKEAFSFIEKEYDKNLLEEILYPHRVIEVSIPVQMDNGSTKVFTGYRSQHNNIKGPYKGGLRFHQDVSKDEVMSLSAWMTLKTSAVGLPIGGGKGGVIVNPKELSAGELERLARGFASALFSSIGSETDVPAPDVNTNPQIMAWMTDEYSKLAGKWTPGVFTGKPIEIGGSQGRGVATSKGGMYVLEQYLAYHKNDLAGKTIAIQGAGNAGLHFACMAHQQKAKVVAISDSRGGIYDAEGLNIAKLEELKAQKKSVTDYGHGKKISNEELLELDVDILVPAALEGVINKDNAKNIKAPIILELANGPVAGDADNILEKNDIVVIPDVLANAGGVTVSYFEQVQNAYNYYREEKEVFQKLEKIMKPATLDIIETAMKHKTSLRNGAYIVALKKILDAMQLRK